MREMNSRLQKKTVSYVENRSYRVFNHLLFSWCELVFAYIAKRTLEIFRKLLKWSSWFDTCLWSAYRWIILPTAYFTNILLHNLKY